MFGPQKGADPAQVRELDAALATFAALLGGDPGASGAGAAGGTGYGLAAAYGAQIVPGADFLADLTGLDASIADADIVLSGEGRFDDQSLTGKVVGQLLAKAQAAGARFGVIAGQVTADADVWSASLTELAGSVDDAIADPARWLRDAGASAARAGLSMEFEYLSRPPDEALLPYVSELWFARGMLPAARELIAPTGGAVLGIVLGDAIRQVPQRGRGEPFLAERGFLIGPDDEAMVNEPTGGTWAVGIVATPVGCAAAFGVHPATIRGAVIDAAAWTGFGVRDELTGAAPSEALIAVEAALAEHLAPPDPGLLQLLPPLTLSRRGSDTSDRRDRRRGRHLTEAPGPRVPDASWG